MYKRIVQKEIQKKYTILKNCLDEKSTRLWCATEAMQLGRGGITTVSNSTGISIPRIRRGIEEVKKPEKIVQNRIRRAGGGRKKLEEKDKNLNTDIEKLVDPVTRGDPESFLRGNSFFPVL